MHNFTFSTEVVEVMRAFERVSKTIWELSNKLNAYYSGHDFFYAVFDETKKEYSLVLDADNLTMFFYYSKTLQDGEGMQQTGCKVIHLN